MDENSKVYKKSVTVWNGDKVIVTDESGQELIRISIDFARIGRCDHYSYVLEQVMNCFEDRGRLITHTGTAIPLDQQLIPGEIFFARDDGETLPCTPRRGPRFKYSRRAPLEGETASTMSNSKRSTPDQKTFREWLLVRDGTCLLTDEMFPECTASHILPMSRPEYYTEVLGDDPQYLYDVHFGLLLRDDLHHAFDRGDWALYPDGTDLIVHYFSPRPSQVQFHGKVIPRSRFRMPDQFLPNRKLLAFHYVQCAQMKLRGWSARMS